MAEQAERALFSMAPTRRSTLVLRTAASFAFAPRGFGAALRLSLQRCRHLTAELALMSKRSVASRIRPLARVAITIVSRVY